MMKFYTFSIAKNKVPKDVFEAIQDTVPLSPDSNEIYLRTNRLADNENHTKWLFEILKKNNLHASGHEVGTGERYNLTIEVDYSQKEIDTAQYLSIHPSARVRAFRSEQSTNCHEIAFWATDHKKFQYNPLIGPTASRVLLAHPDIVEEVKASNLIGPDIFTPKLYSTEKMDKSITWESIGMQRQCISSQIELPQMHPDVLFLDSNRERWTPESNQGIDIAMDGRFIQQTIHYLKSDLDAVGPFDIAYTCEVYGGGRFNMHTRRNIVSRRLYDILTQYDDDLSPVPVFIHDE